MPWSTPIPVYFWFPILVGLGIFFWKRQPNNRLTIFLVWLDFLAINFIFYNIINWSIVNHYLRYLCFVIPALILVHTLFQLHGVPWRPDFQKRSAATIFLIAVILLPLFVWANVRVLASTRYDQDGPVPLLVLVPTYGMWVVTNGGNAEDGVGMSNYANPIFPPDGYTDPSMAYGVDFMEITIRGNVSAKGSRPGDFRVYEGFNSEVFSPCQGTVAFVEGGNPEKEVGDRADGLGDRVVVKCFEVYVTVANLRNIVVKENDAVDVGQTIGYVGNTGSPSIPHLHVHASTNSYGPDGTPVPLLFEYKFASRGMIFLR